jgi:hypothetical protein
VSYCGNTNSNVILKDSVRTAKQTQNFSSIKNTNWLILYKETIAVYTDNHTKSIKRRVGQTQLLNAKACDTFLFHWSSKGHDLKLSRYTPWRRLWGEEVQLLILNLGTRWGEWSASRPGRALLPGKGPRCPGGWEGPRTGLDAEARRKILCLCRGGSNPSCSVRSQTLYWLSYPGSKGTWLHGIKLTLCVTSYGNAKLTELRKREADISFSRLSYVEFHKPLSPRHPAGLRVRAVPGPNVGRIANTGIVPPRQPPSKFLP